MTSASQGPVSVVRGVPLSDEPGLGPLTLPGYLCEVTRRFADREALVMHHPDGAVERWSYADLWERAMEVARALVAGGVGKDSRVGILMSNRPEWISAFFGVGLAGGVAVVLSTFSTLPELEYLLRSSGVSIMLLERHVLKKDFAAMLAELEADVRTSHPGTLRSLKFPFLRRLVMVGSGAPLAMIETWTDFLAGGRATPASLVEAIAAAANPADPGVLFFSSGSTGRPKGILSSYRAVAIQCWRWRRHLGLGDDVRTLTVNGLFWSGNFCQAIGATFSSGGALVLLPTFVPGEALRLMERERVTFPTGWPHQWARLQEAPNWSSVDLSSLRYVDTSTVLGRHPTVSTNWVNPVWSYGNTETFTISTGFPSGTPPEVAGETHGEPLPGNTIKIVDPLTGAVLPQGQSGEIAVKGPTLMLGYIGIPLDETLDEEGFFRTGDAGHMDDRGRLIWYGRLTDVIKTGGANVSPIEVDVELARHRGVSRSQTVGVPHDTLGEMVVSCIVPKEGCVLEEEAVREFLRTRLASYKTPRRILFVKDEELSVTGSDKVKTAALREWVAGRLRAETGGT